MARLAGDAATLECRQHILLSWLAERQAVERQRFLQLIPPVLIAAQGKRHYSPLYPGVAGVNPEGGKAVRVVSIVCRCGIENGAPGVCDAGGQCLRPIGGSHVFADGVPFVAVHPALALLEINGVAGKVPMHDGVTPPVKIDALLPDGSSRKNERPERRVERCPDLGEPGFLVASLRAAKPQSVPAGERDTPVVKVIGNCSDLVS